jgi:hypothetical protein
LVIEMFLSVDVFDEERVVCFLDFFAMGLTVSCAESVQRIRNANL